MVSKERRTGCAAFLLGWIAFAAGWVTEVFNPAPQVSNSSMLDMAVVYFLGWIPGGIAVILTRYFGDRFEHSGHPIAISLALSAAVMFLAGFVLLSGFVF